MVRLSSFVFAAAIQALVDGTAATSSEGCHADNCYRAIVRRAEAGQEFCSDYLAGSYTAALPTYVTPCTSGPTPISSACKCALPTSTTISTTSSSLPTTSSTCSAPAVTVTSVIQPCPTDEVGPWCLGPVNDQFDYGFCGWNKNSVTSDSGNIVSVSSDGTFGPQYGSYMWVGKDGLSQPAGFCKEDNPNNMLSYCSRDALVRTTDATCGVTLCFWKDFDDSDHYICSNGGPEDYQSLGAEDGWIGTGFQYPRAWGNGSLYDGQIWTISVFTDCNELYIDSFHGGCQK